MSQKSRKREDRIMPYERSANMGAEPAGGAAGSRAPGRIHVRDERVRSSSKTYGNWPMLKHERKTYFLGRAHGTVGRFHRRKCSRPSVRGSSPLDYTPRCAIY